MKIHTIALFAVFLVAAGTDAATTPVKTPVPVRHTTAPAAAARVAPRPDAEIEQSIKTRMAASRAASSQKPLGRPGFVFVFSAIESITTV